MDSWYNQSFLFSIAEQSVFTSMRIQTAHQQLGMVSPDSMQGFGRQFDGVQDSLNSQQLWDFGVTAMNCCKRAGNRGRVLHHAPAIAGCSPLSKHFGVPGIVMPGQVQCLFVDGGSGNRLYTSALTGVYCGLYETVGGLATLALNLARLKCL
jgi:hypothetical protein